MPCAYLHGQCGRCVHCGQGVAAQCAAARGSAAAVGSLPAVRCRAVHADLCGNGIIQSGADGLSRGKDVYDCCLRSDAFAQLWAWRGPSGVDCCAAPGAIQRDPRTRRSLPYVSPYGGPQAVGADVLTFCG